MATAQARAEQYRSGLRVRILDRRGRARWNEMWDGNPRLPRPTDGGTFSTIVNAPGARPYIDYARTTEHRWAWNALRPEPGEIYGLARDMRGAERLLVEPSIKARASPNKAWKGWPEFVSIASRAGLRLAQMCAPGQGNLSGVERIETATFRSACAVLAQSLGIVTHEGGLHHAAAALGKPAVVIFGGYISPLQTGYAAHVNLFTGGEPCGWRTPCAHCMAAMKTITPEMVAQEAAMIYSARREAA